MISNEADENVNIFNTPLKNGGPKKMVWNSPFQSLQPKSSSGFEVESNSNYSSLDFSALQPDGLLDFATNQPASNQLQNHRNHHHHNTDIPVLDDLFTELNSDLHFDPLNKSEPVNLEDIERILLPQHANPNQRKPIIRQPFSSILNSFSDESISVNNSINGSYNQLPTGPFDEGPMLWDGSVPINENGTTQSGLIPLHSQVASSSQIQIKVIGKRPRESDNLLLRGSANPATTTTATTSIRRVVPYIPAPINTKPAKSYRTYGKKRYVIGPEYADFVCRLQNDIPFDSSEDDEDEQFANETSNINSSSINSDTADNNKAEFEEEEEEEEESDEEEPVKISSQELLELFEDSCSGLPGLISAYLTHRKHQIGLKGYKPRVPVAKSASSLPPLLNQGQFDRIRAQIKLHFQFLIQTLALSNEIEGAEGITLLSLKLLVQLHLHLDSNCNLKNSSGSTGSSDTNNNNPNNNNNSSSISCLTIPNPRVNPIVSRLSELVPQGIKKVSVIAGFLIRPGQKQFLSLAALRSDASLKPKTGNFNAPPLAFKIKPFQPPVQRYHYENTNSTASNNGHSHGSQQILSNAFYNILGLFHDYIDPKLMEQSISVNNLVKYLVDFGPVDPQSQQFTRTAKFLASEDNLLLCGLHRFGCGNWDSIQAQFLPYRTGRQLAIRYKNLSSRREPMNPIKAFNENLMMPLSEIEEDLLFKGVQRFGNQFHLISKHYLPHRPATVLGKLWKAMDDAHRMN